MDFARISSENIRLLIESNHSSVRQLAEKIGISPSTLHDALKSKKGVPIDVLIKIADYFNTTVPILCGKYEISGASVSPLSEMEHLHIQKYRQLSPAGQKALDQNLDSLLELEMKPNTNSYRIAARGGKDIHEISDPGQKASLDSLFDAVERLQGNPKKPD